MSEPTDQNHSDPMDDKDLSALYTRGSIEQPSKALDQAILDKARKATSQRSTKIKGYYPWQQAVSVAAVLVVSVTVVMLVRKEAPHPLSNTRQLAMVQEQQTEAKPVTKPLPQPAKRQAETQKEVTLPAENRVAPMALQDLLAKKKRAQKEIKAQRRIRARDRAMDKAIEASPAMAPAREAPTQESISSGKISPNQLARGFVGGNVKGLASEGKTCTQLTEQECFTSAACSLTKSKTTQGYQCRPAKDHCELMFRQSDGTKESCEAKQGCVYLPASCYCPPGAECRCDGGEPSQCRSTNE
jgi:hypothetical protein